jgi:hypothetical protein
MTRLRAACGLIAVLLAASPLAARTITLTAEDCDQIAVLSPVAPRVSWGVTRHAAGVFDTTHQLQLYQNTTLLIRFPLDKIPKGQRITKAELTFKAEYKDGEPKAQLRRVLAEWGPGVCHLYRMTYPKKVEWAQPGGRGGATDIASKVTATVLVQALREYTVDVTEDVELWYTGAAANRGWSLWQDTAYALYLPSPYNPHSDSARLWKLRITYEPQ